MYAVVGSDGVVYGPVPVTTIREWIVQGRVLANTTLIDWQGHQWAAHAVPELQGAFPALPQAYAVPMLGYGPGPKKRSTALWLALLLGSFGAHRFYLGHTVSGVVMLLLGLLGLVTCIPLLITSIWALADAGLIASGGMRDATGRALA